MKKMLHNERIRELKLLCQSLGVEFNDISFLHQALTHTSFANESKHAGAVHNERLEFLGDAVLDLVISDRLFKRFPDLPEGELTKARAHIVCEATLARCAAEVGIGQYLLLGKGEDLSGGRERISILADAFEAVIGAIYLDTGFASVSQFILHKLHKDLHSVESGHYVKDYKTLLQEIVQKNSDSRIAYEIISEHGPDHDKIFEVAVIVNTDRMGTGLGRSKKEAEQKAAKQALLKMKIINDD
jgi:ribonuclease-3